jgi:hypothetical protein
VGGAVAQVVFRRSNQVTVKHKTGKRACRSNAWRIALGVAPALGQPTRCQLGWSNSQLALITNCERNIMDQMAAIITTSIIPIASFAFAAFTLYRTTKKEFGESASNILRLKIVQALKNKSLKESEISQHIDPINNSTPRKDILSQLYVLLKDGMITQTEENGEWVYALKKPAEDKSPKLSDEKTILICKYSYECIERWDSQDLRVFRDVIRKFFTKGSSVDKEALYAQLKIDQELSRSLIFVFNYFQELSGKISCGLIDKTIIYNALGDAYIRIHEMFFAWVTDFMHLDDRMKSDLTRLYEDIKQWRRN